MFVEVVVVVAAVDAGVGVGAGAGAIAVVGTTLSDVVVATGVVGVVTFLLDLDFRLTFLSFFSDCIIKILETIIYFVYQNIFVIMQSEKKDKKVKRKSKSNKNVTTPTTPVATTTSDNVVPTTAIAPAPAPTPTPASTAATTTTTSTNIATTTPTKQKSKKAKKQKQSHETKTTTITSASVPSTPTTTTQVSSLAQTKASVPVLAPTTVPTRTPTPTPTTTTTTTTTPAPTPTSTVAAVSIQPAESKVKKRKRTDDEDESEDDEKKEEENENGSKKIKIAVQEALPKSEDKIIITENDEKPSITNFRISAPTIQILQQNNYHTLFPIQARTYDFVYDGKDLIGRARTGTGKTLSFMLPIVERLRQQPDPQPYRGRGPRLVILTPTRELAIQVEGVAQMLAQKLSSLCIYGGVPYGPQEAALRRGIDVLVGTPGRILDHLKQNKLSFANIQYFVCDEADRMLDMGFLDDVEDIMSEFPKEKHVQKLLYSATIPSWVHELSHRYLQNHVTVDLVSNNKKESEAAENVTHIAMMMSADEALMALSEVIQFYAKGGKTIVFTETKQEANDITLNSSISSMCQVLHGDIAQSTREATLASFKNGNFQVLVATDVAARGIDIEGVDLVVQMAPPKDIERYVHRSGRTGRACKAGTSLTFYTRGADERRLSNIERTVHLKFIHAQLPTFKDKCGSLGTATVKDILNVDKEVIPFFEPFVQPLIEKFGDSDRALAATLAALCKCTKKEERSILSHQLGFTALKIECNGNESIQSENRLRTIIRSELPPSRDDTHKLNFGMIKFCKDDSVLVDVSSHLAKKITERNVSRGEKRLFTMTIATEVPPLEIRPQTNRMEFRGGNRFRRDSGGGGGGGRFRSGGGGGGGGGGRFRSRSGAW
eukprot:TRINITY_DN2128_c1_g3_i1.p1 TRINITY_DN2128_c1_g3~~TRINITY_DN2128_c1_g3_i1.p1  ORF type:complete len:888 (+),score=221.87 TRINITY_DN2128_c1_g3_i1:2304-4967(+)